MSVKRLSEQSTLLIGDDYLKQCASVQHCKPVTQLGLQQTIILIID